MVRGNTVVQRIPLSKSRTLSSGKQKKTNQTICREKGATTVSIAIAQPKEWSEWKEQSTPLINIGKPRVERYIGTQYWNQGRTQEIAERVMHMSIDAPEP